MEHVRKKGNKDRLLRCLTVILIIVMLVSLGGGLALAADGESEQQYTFTYTGPSTYGYVVGGLQTALLQIKSGDNGSLLDVYCCDMETYTVDDYIYKRTNIEGGEHYKVENAPYIRAILHNAYPFITLKEVVAAAGIANLTVKEAITATQMAVWHYSNSANLVMSGQSVAVNKRINDLYNYLISLEPIPATGVVAGIKIEVEETRSNGKSNFKIVYYADGTNNDGTPVALTYSLDKQLDELYGAKIGEAAADGAGKYTLTIDGVPASQSFVMSVWGSQSVVRDGYLYYPYDGYKQAQSLVGAFGGATPIAAEKSIAALPAGSVEVKVEDSLTAEPAANVTVKLGTQESLADGTTVSAQTNDEGVAVFSNLEYGTYYVGGEGLSAESVEVATVGLNTSLAKVRLLRAYAPLGMSGGMTTGETNNGENPAGETNTGENSAGETNTGENPAGETNNGENLVGRAGTGESSEGDGSTEEPLVLSMGNVDTMPQAGNEGQKLAANANQPYTGDNTGVQLCFLLSAASFVALIVIVLVRGGSHVRKRYSR